MKRIVSFLCILWLGISMRAGNYGTVTTYDESCGMSQWHITQMLQDGEGYIWFATWNGLNRFDGYELVNFKSRSLASDRIRNICLNERGNLWCKIEDDVYEFDLKTYKFSPVPESNNQENCGCVFYIVLHRKRYGAKNDRQTGQPLAFQQKYVLPRRFV